MQLGDKQWQLQVSLVVGGGYRNSMLMKASSPGELKSRVEDMIRALNQWAETLPEQSQ